MNEVQPTIILVEAQLGQNIGTAARAMANFGLNEMRLVNPRDGWPSEWATKAAAGATHVVDNAQVFNSTTQAISDLHHVYATTARGRDLAKAVLTPEDAAKDMRERTALGQRVGILYGREKSGLTNDDITLADSIIMAPVDPEFASLNLAQAVLLNSYEWFKLGNWSLGDGSREDGAVKQAGLRLAGSWPATKEELVGFFEHLEKELDEAGFLRPPERRPSMVRNLRNLFQRANLSEQEIRTLRGVVASLVRQHKRSK